MKIHNGTIILEDDVFSITPSQTHVRWRDKSGTYYEIPASLVVRLYDVFKWNLCHKSSKENENMTEEQFAEYCDSFFKMVTL